MKHILFIHQSAELYGSDKTLLNLVCHLDKAKYLPIVVLPNDGLLVNELKKYNIDIHISPVLKLHRNLFKPLNLLKFIKDFFIGYKQLNKLNKQYKFDLIYSNTLAVLLGYLYSKTFGIKHLWHVHEIIEHPKIFIKLYKIILSQNSNNILVYNSIETQNFWNVQKTKNKVIWNGLEPNETSLRESQIKTIKTNHFKAKNDEIVICLVGRISRWKGHQVLIDAFKTISERNVKLVFIGSTPPNQNEFLNKLNKKITHLNLDNKVTIIPFQQNIKDFWQCIDIAVVPSTEPEPFGLVALEAMLAKKPVIGSNHGGLKEIIINQKTGFLVTPSDEKALADALLELIENPEMRKTFGENGYNRAIENFSIEKYVQSFEKTFESL